MAKQRLLELRNDDPNASLTSAKNSVARGYDFPDWRKLKEAIRDRRQRGERLEAALRDRDQQSVLAALTTDAGVVVDVALKAAERDLAFLGNVGRNGPKAAVATLHVVLFALAAYGRSPDLPWQLGAIVLPDFDWQAAMTVLEDRRREAESNPRPDVSVEVLEEAISALAIYDEPEFDGELSDD